MYSDNNSNGSNGEEVAPRNSGAVISIIVIVCMIMIGAFYEWGRRVAQENLSNASSGQQQSVAQ